jgi:hypothetical protein
MEDHALRLYIRAKLANDHLLPFDSVPHVWGGPGNGETCDGCEETITKDQLVMEGVGIRGDEVQFHVKCFYVWVAEPTDLSVIREPRDGQALIWATGFSTYSPIPSHAPPPGTPVAGP